MSISDLFSQIGGALGLFVSFSIFTLFEFMELLILIIWGLLFEKKRTIDVQKSEK
jgi:formate hydrogenlyase subunit 3/multisubunit Na+/H+ antiporter MnhD subunit